MTDLKKDFLKIKSWEGLEGVADWWLAKLEAAREEGFAKGNLIPLAVQKAALEQAREEGRREAQDEIRAWAKAHGKNYKELRDFVDFMNNSRDL